MYVWWSSICDLGSANGSLPPTTPTVHQVMIEYPGIQFFPLIAVVPGGTVGAKHMSPYLHIKI